MICSITHRNYIEGVQPLIYMSQLRMILQSNIRKRDLLQEGPTPILHCELTSEHSMTNSRDLTDDQMEIRTWIHWTVGDLKSEMRKVSRMSSFDLKDFAK